MSDFNYSPDYDGTSVDHAPRVKRAPFGDGYQQRTPDGINTDLEIWTVTFKGTVARIQAIETQLKGYGAATAFTWTPYGHSEIKVICSAWTRNKTAFGADTLTAKFEQVPEA